MNNKIDITPKTKIYSIFQNMNYKLESSISELIDNSISSFRQNKSFFDENQIEKTIILFFDNMGKTIFVIDNAFGISEEDLPRVLKLADIPKDTTGLNEYGMGLKASSFWLGSSLKVISKYKDYKNSNTLGMNLEELENDKNEIDVINDDSYLNFPFLKKGHGTFIEIKGIRRNIINSTITPLVQSLSSKYRNDILDGINIKILAKEKNGKISDICQTFQKSKKIYIENNKLYNAVPLKYKEVEFYKNNKNQILKKEKSFEIEHENKKLKFHGVFGIKKEGSRKDYYAFDLFRRNRIVKKGYDHNLLFGQTNSFETLRITGWFHMDDFPTNQQKDDLAWEGELEGKFLKIIAEDEDFQEIKKFAHSIRTKGTKKIEDIKKSENDKANKLIEAHFRQIQSHTYEETKELAIKNSIKFDNTALLHTIQKDDEQYIKIYSRLSENNPPEEWIKIDNHEEDKLLVVSLDMNHTFFHPFNDNSNFLKILRLFAICFAISVRESLEKGKNAEDFKKYLGKLIHSNKEEFDV